MSQPFVTRAQSAEYQGLDPRVIEAMAERAYEATRHSRSSAPPWARVEEAYKAERRMEQVAGVIHALSCGYLKRAGA